MIDLFQPFNMEATVFNYSLFYLYSFSIIHLFQSLWLTYFNQYEASSVDNTAMDLIIVVNFFSFS